jgi:hypothetical protein
LIFNTTSSLSHGYPGADGTALHNPTHPQPYAGRLPMEKPGSGLLESKTDGPGTDLDLDGLLLHRQEIIDSRIRMILSETYQRRLIKQYNLYRINLDQCDFRNLIFELGEHCWDKKRLELERRIIDLEEEKRTEEKSYFKDLLFLKKELRDSLIERIEEEQKANMLTGLEEESP